MLIIKQITRTEDILKSQKSIERVERWRKFISVVISKKRTTKGFKFLNERFRIGI